MEVKEDQDEGKKTSGEYKARKVSRREPFPEELQRVCKRAQFDLTEEEW